MGLNFSEEQVHQYIYEVGLECLVDDSTELDIHQEDEPKRIELPDGEVYYEEVEFELWRILKEKTLGKIRRLHNSVRYGEFVGSKIKLPIDNTVPMELDLLGQHEDGIFILELKVNRSAERNAFSELFAYSNYIAEMFALSGHKDITNVLVATMDAKITRQAFLYDLIISDRNIIVYRPVVHDGGLENLRLQVHVPSDDDFRGFANQLLSHDAMSCVVTSFHDLEGWFDSEEVNGGLNTWTKDHLEKLSGYTAQLMESEHLHGFCFVRKPWGEMPRYYRNSLIICAINPFKLADSERANDIIRQIDKKYQISFFENPELAFDGRLLDVAKRAINDSLTHKYEHEFETPLWSAMVHSMHEVVFTHNFGFRPTGVLREAYVGYLNGVYSENSKGRSQQDVSILKINEISDWFGAWTFMEMCGFTEIDDDEEEGDESELGEG